MKFSRRNFIKLGSATTLGILGFGGVSFGRTKSFFADDLPAGMFSDPLFGHSADVFKKYIGTSFSMITESVALTVVLSAVKSSVVPGRNRRAECFTLTFNLPSDSPQATYAVFHPNLGNFDLFLVPGKTNEAKSLLHAVVNRI